MRTLFSAIVMLAFGLPALADVNVGDKPQLRLRLLDNSVLTSKDVAGKIVVLEFWATWCPPCRDQVPHLKAINEKYGPKGVLLVSVSQDDSRGPVTTFIRQNGMNWTHAVDAEQPQRLAPAFGVSGIPHAFILSPEGQVLWRGHPMSLDKDIDKAMAEHPPKPSTETVRAQALAAIAKAADLIDQNEDYAGAYEAIVGLTDEAIKDPKVAPKFRALAVRFKPTGKRAESLAKFYEKKPEAKERLAKLGVEVG